MSLSDIIRAWLNQPVLDRLTELEERTMANLDALEAAATRNGEAVTAAVSGISDLRSKIAALQAAVDQGQLDEARVAAITASIDASADSIAQALAPVIEDPETPTDGEVPPETNPDTVDPGSVDGSVPAGEPLPDA